MNCGLGLVETVHNEWNTHHLFKLAMLNYATNFKTVEIDGWHVQIILIAYCRFINDLSFHEMFTSLKLVMK